MPAVVEKIDVSAHKVVTLLPPACLVFALPSRALPRRALPRRAAPCRAVPRRAAPRREIVEVECSCAGSIL